MARKALKSAAVVAIAVAVGRAYFWRGGRSQSRSPSSDRHGQPATTPVRGGRARLPRSEASRRPTTATSIAARPATYSRSSRTRTLVRVNRVTDTLEPWLAESWTESPITCRSRSSCAPACLLRRHAAHVRRRAVFVSRALRPARPLPARERHARQWQAATDRSPDPSTVHRPVSRRRLRQDCGWSTACRILPRHRLERALAEGQFNDAWSVNTPLTEIAGLGPFVLVEHVSGERLVLTRNPHYWRKDPCGHHTAVSRQADDRVRESGERGAEAAGGRDRLDDQRRHSSRRLRGVQARRRSGTRRG